MEIEVSVVMPCLNEEKTVGECIEAAREGLRRAEAQGEIIVADNGSTDHSVAIATSLGARVVHVKERGYGNAYLGGFREATGKYLVMGDSDSTYDFTEMPKFLSLLRDGHEFVTGSRLKGEMSDGAMPPLHRFVGVPLLTFLLNRVTGSKVSDSHCGLRAFTREAYQKMALSSPGMEFASEMIMKAALAKLAMAEIPTSYRPRRGQSKLRSFRDGWRHLRFILIKGIGMRVGRRFRRKA